MIQNHTGYILSRKTVDAVIKDLAVLRKNGQRSSELRMRIAAKNGTPLNVRLDYYGVLTQV